MADNIFSFVIPLVAFLAITRIPTVTSITYATCKGGFYDQYCRNYFSTNCCSSGFFNSATCCSARTSCYDGYYTYRACSQYSHSKCCYRTALGSSSCCGYSDYSRTSRSRYSSSMNTYTRYDAPLGAIIGGVIGGLVILVLIIVIPVVACGVCAAGANRRGRQGQVRQTTVVTHNQAQPMQGAYVNQGYAPTTYGQAMPPPGPGMPPTGPSQFQPPPYNQAVMLSGPGHAGAPPTAAMYPQPGGQYPPPTTTVNPPQYPPPGAGDAKNMTTSN